MRHQSLSVPYIHQDGKTNKNEKNKHSTEPERAVSDIATDLDILCTGREGKSALFVNTE